MKNILVRILKSSDILLALYNSLFRLLNEKKFHNEIANRESESLFKFNELSKELPFYPETKIKDANFYGHYYWLKKYSGLENFDFSIEHGLYLGSHVPVATYLKTTKKIITFSKVREQHLRNAGIDKPILKIGPYIHYSDSLLRNEEFNTIKKKYGKILTVFPSHSIKGFNVVINHENFLSEINKIASDFDSVFICVYFKDINNGTYVDDYLKRGYNVVTAGHRYDLNFLSRLKSIIELSDYTLSNTVGTHSGYCVYLNKPHYICNQVVTFENENGKKSVDYRKESEAQQLVYEKNEIAQAFKDYVNEITVPQKMIIDKYWGLSEIRNREELRTELLHL